MWGDLFNKGIEYASAATSAATSAVKQGVENSQRLLEQMDKHLAPVDQEEHPTYLSADGEADVDDPDTFSDEVRGALDEQAPAVKEEGADEAEGTHQQASRLLKERDDAVQALWREQQKRAAQAAEIAELRRAADQFENQTRSIIKLLEDTRAEAEEKERVKEVQVKLLREDLQHAKHTIEQYQQAVSEHERMVERLQITRVQDEQHIPIEQHHQAVSEKEEIIESLHKARAAAERQLEGLNKELEDLRLSIGSQQLAESEQPVQASMVETYSAELHQVRSALQAATVELQEWKQLGVSKDNQLSCLQGQVLELESKLSSVCQKSSELQAMNDKLRAEYEATVSKLEASLDDLHTCKQAQEAERGKWDAERAKLEASASELVVCRERQLKREGEVERDQKEKDALLSKLALLEAEIQNLHTASATEKSLTEQVAELSQREHAVNEQLLSLNEQVAELSQREHAVNEQLLSLSAQRDALLLENDTLLKSLESLDTKIKNAYDEIASKSLKITAATRELEAMKLECKASNEQQVLAENRKSEYEAAMKEQAAAHLTHQRAWEEESVILRSQLNSAEARASALSTHLQAQRSQVQGHASCARESLKRLREELFSLRTALQQSIDSAMSDSVTLIESRLMGLASELASARDYARNMRIQKDACEVENMRLSRELDDSRQKTSAALKERQDALKNVEILQVEVDNARHRAKAAQLDAITAREEAKNTAAALQDARVQAEEAATAFVSRCEYDETLRELNEARGALQDARNEAQAARQDVVQSREAVENALKAASDAALELERLKSKKAGDMEQLRQFNVKIHELQKQKNEVGETNSSSMRG
jgi:chromosome segregation ATPase